MSKKYENYFDEDDNNFQMPLPKIKKKPEEIEKEYQTEQVEHFDSIDELQEKYGDCELLNVETMGEILAEQMLVDEEEMDPAVLEEKYQEDPFDFNVLVRLILFYRESGQIDKLEEMRNHTISYFPLSEEMWLDWIKDKKSGMKKDEVGNIIVILNFMRKALSDFYYPKVCVKFLKTMIKLKNYSDEYSLETIRRYFDEFLKIWGLDFNYSTSLYDLYMTFEKNNLAQATDVSAKNLLIKNIRSIYKRRLSHPHIDLDIIWSEYKKWETDENEKVNIENKYKEVILFNPGFRKCRKDT
jgi:hypothetical protein